MWLGLTKRSLPVGYLAEYLEHSVERLIIFGIQISDSCSMTSELQKTSLGFNSLSSVVITLWTQGRKGLIDPQFKHVFCLTLYILMMVVWLAAFFWYSNTGKGLAFLVCLSSPLYETSSGSTHVWGGTNLPFPFLHMLPSSAWGSAWVKWWFSWWKKMVVHTLHQRASSPFFCPSLSLHVLSRALFSAELPREKKTKVPQCLVGGNAEKSLVPDEYHCLWAPTASNTSLINF